MNIYAVHFFGTVPFLHKKPCFFMQKDFKKSVGNSPEMVHTNIYSFCYSPLIRKCEKPKEGADMENENNVFYSNNGNTDNAVNPQSVMTTPKKKKKKKRKKKKSGIFSMIIATILITVAVTAVVGCIAVYQIWDEYSHTDCGEERVTVTIPRGASGAKIANILKENGVIKNELAFRLKLKNSSYKNELNYGEFELKKNMPYNDIIDALRVPSALREGVSVTVPEGYSAEMIAQLFEEKGFCTSNEFLKELSEGEFEYDFIKNIPDTPGVKYKLQGYLFPSTHSFPKDADAHEIIDKLLGEFEKQYSSVLGNQYAPIAMNEAIIRASLIEREAKLDSERETISGVIQNRLDTGMKLQIDATVVYAISDGMYDIDRVLYSDLEIDSPYNTYKNGGLPIGAICNPGIKSITAAMYPESHSYIYYHTDTEKNDGSHIFSETFSQHTNS